MRIKAVRKGAIFGKLPNQLKPVEQPKFRSPREVLETASSIIGVCSIAMDKNGLWYFGKTKLTLLENSCGWYSPAGTIPVKLGLLPTNVDWKKSMEIL